MNFMKLAYGYYNPMSPILSHPGPDKNPGQPIHWLYRADIYMTSSDVVFPDNDIIKIAK